jgi:SAM-dependent methyltransferase
MWADQAVNRLLAGDYAFATVLDVGSGPGEHAAVFRAAGKTVTTTDLATDGDYLALNFAPHDLVWCSHVLEHQPNAGLFLAKLIRDCRDGGILAITVPPLKHEIVGGHVSLWNAGLLLYRLALTGLDCRDARVKTYGYNISVIVRNHRLPLPPLRWDSGDITALSGHLPPFAAEGFYGAIEEFNW